MAITDEQVKAAMRAWNKGSYASDKGAMRAALEAADAAAWRPIEEAPDDEYNYYLQSYISFYTNKRQYIVAFFDCAYEEFEGPIKPTHWRPLPTPPKEPPK